MLSSGELGLITPAEMGQFVEGYRASIRRTMLDNYPPRYIPRRFQSDPQIRQIEAGIPKLKRKPLGGQRLAIAGAALSLRQQRGTVLSAEQGSGKSLMGAGAAWLAGMRRVIVVCPSHLTRKWVREVQNTIPGARGVVVKTVSELQKACSEIERHEQLYPANSTLSNYQSGNLIALRDVTTRNRASRGRLGTSHELRASHKQPSSQHFGDRALPPLFVIVSKEMLKLDSRWQPAVIMQTPRPVPRDPSGNLVLDKQPHCPRCGQLIPGSNDDEAPAISLAALATRKRYCPGLIKDGKGRNRSCREPLWQKVARRVGQSPFEREAADKREAWVEQQVQTGCEVLICHPRLVQTGLDLLAFPTLVFYQVEYSVYVQRQASRRSWRIGQRVPVEVYHLVYQDSAQSRALRHQARKMQASNLLDGDLSAEGMVSLAEEGQHNDNLMLELARALVRQNRGENGIGSENNNSSKTTEAEDQLQIQISTSEDKANEAEKEEKLSLEELLVNLRQHELATESFMLDYSTLEAEELEAAIIELYQALSTSAPPQQLISRGQLNPSQSNNPPQLSSAQFTNSRDLSQVTEDSEGYEVLKMVKQLPLF